MLTYGCLGHLFLFVSLSLEVPTTEGAICLKRPVAGPRAGRHVLKAQVSHQSGELGWSPSLNLAKLTLSEEG